MVLFSPSVNAASLGAIRISSALGERFEATISVTQTDAEMISPACLQLVSPQETGEVRTLHRARLDYRKTAQGGEIRIQGEEYEQEPLLLLALRLRCPEEAVRGFTREYSILLDPRDYKAALATPPIPTVSTPLAEEKPAASSAPRQVLRQKPTTSTVDRKAARSTTASKARPSTPAPQAAASDEFRLQLSTTPLDPARASMQLSDDEKNKLRERLLLIEADDQSAQLLQMKDRISRLEKQLVAMQALAASHAATVQATTSLAQEKDQESNWLWAALAGLLLVPVGLIARRSRTRKDAESDSYLYEMQPERPAEIGTPATTSVTQPAIAPRPIATSNEEWGANDMDVVAPETVLEEVQLLQAHGLTRQATDLLLQEVALRPSALALWMKLFSLYQDSGDRAGFEKNAHIFREHFVSQSLWRQVQAQGRTIDPENSLYAPDGHEASETIKPAQEKESFTSPYFMPQESATDQGEPEQDAVAQQDVTLEFQLPEVPSEYQADISWKPDPIARGQSDKPIFDFDIPSLELPTRESGIEKAFTTDEFSSSDAVLQAIAQEILTGDRQEACRQLEELLYRGTTEQRMQAAKWLDKLLPVK